MKHYVITILDNPRSVEVADRCIKSGSYFNIEVEKWKAITPKDDPIGMMAAQGMEYRYFDEKYSRRENCISAFMSHYSLWKECVEINEEITIFEHDAVIKGNIPDRIRYQGCISLGQPSYGNYVNPNIIGVNPLTSKKYFPGAHAYRVNPTGARELVKLAQHYARPTDIFLSTTMFPFLEEYYPWPVVADDSFSTIQNVNGIQAKHGYAKRGSDYEII